MSIRVNRSFAPCARLELIPVDSHSLLSAINIDDQRRIRWNCITTLGLLLEPLPINPCFKEQNFLLFDARIPRVRLYTCALKHLVSAYILPSFPDFTTHERSEHRTESYDKNYKIFNKIMKHLECSCNKIKSNKVCICILQIA